MQIIYAVFSGSVIRKGSGKLAATGHNKKAGPWLTLPYSFTLFDSPDAAGLSKIIRGGPFCIYILWRLMGGI
jgi:hypothetical protein